MLFYHFFSHSPLFRFNFFGKNYTMKKIIVFVLVLFMVGLSYFAKNKEIPLFNLDSATKVCFVVDENEKILGDITQCGTKKFVYMSLAEAREEVGKIKFDAVQFYFDKDVLNDVLEEMKAEKVSSQKVQGADVEYYYSPYFQDSVLIEGKKVNMQIALKDGEVIAGLPLILTGY